MKSILTINNTDKISNKDLLYAYLFENQSIPEYSSSDVYPDGKIVYKIENGKAVLYKMTNGALKLYTIGQISNLKLNTENINVKSTVDKILI
ncbi:MAG: hypothetical protein PHF63_00085 [Herbinix sp.]|nr:hypothetical protein [Herbinix sp.]